MAKIVGYRQGVHQHWPIYSHVPRRNPLHVGGTCPPYAPLTRVAGGYACVETRGPDPSPFFGARMQLVGIGEDPAAPSPETLVPSGDASKAFPSIPGLGPLISDADIRHYAAVAVDAAWPAMEKKLDAKVEEYKKPVYVAAAVAGAAYALLLSILLRKR